MRRITGLLFCGNMDALKKIELLQNRLSFAIEQLSAQQQGENIDPTEIKDVVCDITAALLGIDFDTKQTLPYPGEFKLFEREDDNE